MSYLLENQLVRTIAGNFKRSPAQLNALHHSDAEILRVGNQVMAFTTDTISEEIESGLYSDPELTGWMSVTSSLSDLAAVGAQPLGLLLTMTLPSKFSDEMVTALTSGIHAACDEHNTFIIGGDTNQGSHFAIGSTAIGVIEGDRMITRHGCADGDTLYSTGPFGIGNAFAFSRLVQASDGNAMYRPTARIAQGQMILKHGSACIDTSDGFISAIANLIEHNQCGFRMEQDAMSVIDVTALALASAQRIPPWYFLVGPHGEFELLCTIPKDREKAFLHEAQKLEWTPLKIGEVMAERRLVMQTSETHHEIDAFGLANLFYRCNSDVKLYLERLQEIEFYDTSNSQYTG